MWKGGLCGNPNLNIYILSTLQENLNVNGESEIKGSGFTMQCLPIVFAEEIQDFV